MGVFNLSFINFTMEKKFLNQISRIKFIMEQVAPTDVVNDFYSKLEQIKQKGGLTKQDKGNVSFQQDVKTLQTALVMAGYKLPRFGVDGLYYSETQSTIDQFLKDNNLQTTGNSITGEGIEVLIKKLKEKNITTDNLKSYVRLNTNDGNGVFSTFDLTTNEGIKQYTDFCNIVLSNVTPNHLGITGEMLVNSARKYLSVAYVPPELALGQLILEGGIGNKDPNVKPVRTKNPYNVGNTDDGSVVKYNSIEEGVDIYFRKITNRYLSARSPIDLLSNFVNASGYRYATDPQYESKLYTIIKRIKLLTNNNQQIA